MDRVFLFGKKLVLQKGKLTALYEITDFYKLVKRRISEYTEEECDYTEEDIKEICLTLIGISLEKNWGLPIAEQRNREYVFKPYLERCFGVSLRAVFTMPNGLVGRIDNVKVQAVELFFIDGYLVMVY
jgi:hypothetical protein